MKNQWQSHLEKKSLIQAVLFGIVTGAVSWSYSLFVDEFENTVTVFLSFLHVAVFSCITLASLALFLYIYRRRASQYRHLVFIPFVLIPLQALLPIVLNRGEDFTNMMIIMMCLTAFLSIGFFLAIQDPVKKSEIPQLFSLFIKKTLEVIFLGLIAMCVFGLIGLMSGLLLEIVDFEWPLDIPEQVYILVVFIGGYITSFLLWVIIYDFSLPLKKQKEMYIILPLLRVISGGIVVFSVIFLGLYILLLIPSGFDSLLKTGNTVPLFLWIIFGVIGAHFFITEKIGRHDFAKWLKSTTITFLALSIEALILLIVAFYAIYKRIDSNGITFARIWVVSLLIIAALVLVRFITIWIGGLLKKYSPQDIVEKLQQTYLWPFIGLAIAVVGSVFINIETLSLSRHLDRLSQKTLITDNIDHSLVESVNPERAIPILVKKYESAGTVNRLDIIYTLDLLTQGQEEYFYFDIRYTSSRSPFREQVSAALEEIEKIETNPDIDSIISSLQELPSPSGGATYCGTYPRGKLPACHARCKIPVADILNISPTNPDLQDFCY